ncbi:MAG TPA: FmdE family protein [Methanoregula sp.]|nr:FmdE family protein [Methanoregula sp.]
MQPGHDRYSAEGIDARMDAANLTPEMKEQIRQCVAFHTSPAPGVLIGAFMADYALELLGARPGEKLFGVCETPKCAPDALQVIAHCTTGNNRLRVIPIGKFAMTVNAATQGTAADAVRVYVDRKKLKNYPVIDAWYANSPAFVKATMSDELQQEIFRAGRGILSSERVRVSVSGKRKWTPVTCPCCGDSIPDYLFEKDRCGGCGSMRYYEKTG